MVACEKTKKILSANPKAPISIECFMNDIDVKGMMARDLFLEKCAPLMVKLEKARDAAGMQPGCSRDAAEMRPRCGRDAAEMLHIYEHLRARAACLRAWA